MLVSIIMNRMSYIFFLVLCVVDFVWSHKKREDKVFSGVKSDSSFCKPDSEQRYDCEIRNHIPAYIWYVLGFISLLLLVVSILLIYVLLKTKFLHTLNLCNRKTKTLTLEKLEDGCAESEVWQTITAGANNLDKTTSQLKNDNENDKTLKRHKSQVTIGIDYNTLRTPKKTEASGNISPKIIIGARKDMPIILPEQMSLICKEVLKRSANHDSTSSLQNIDKLVKEGKPAKEAVLKCASTSDLGSSGLDNLPIPHCNEKHKTKNPIILPEQMSLICKEVLKRSANHDSTSSLQNIDQLVKEGKPAEEAVLKCASTSDLDSSVLDNLPIPHCNEKHKTKNPIILAEQMSLICKAVLKRSAKQESDSTSRVSQLVKEETVAKCDENKGKDKDVLNEKSTTSDDSQTRNEIYDSPTMLDYLQDSIYDLPKDSAAKVENQTGYITPYFSANPSSSATFEDKEQKLHYSLINELSMKQNTSKTERNDKEKKGNIINEKDSSNDFIQDSVYESPKHSAAKLENQTGHATPHFANPSSSQILQDKEEKPDALVNKSSTKQNACTTQCKDTEKKYNVINQNDALNDCYYDHPKCNSQNQLYINANEVKETQK